MNIERSEVPSHALLKTHIGKQPERWGGYQDCFRVHVTHEVQIGEFVHAFYTTRLFKLERFLLRIILGIHSSDADANALVAGTGRTFAAWYEGARSSTQLLMCDRYESTRSWFMANPAPGGGSELCFGSAVAQSPDTPYMPPKFRLLLGFHVFYSKLLLGAAARRLAAIKRSRPSAVAQ